MLVFIIHLLFLQENVMFKFSILVINENCQLFLQQLKYSKRHSKQTLIVLHDNDLVGCDSFYYMSPLMRKYVFCINKQLMRKSACTYAQLYVY